MWRKNRNKFHGTDCVGVDLNRNWGVHWGGKTFDLISGYIKYVSSSKCVMKPKV